MENILFYDGPPGKGCSRIKIIDFGCARYFGKNETMKGIFGSANYVAPEMISGNYDCKVDVFSAGIIFYAMMTLKLPHDGSNNAQILDKI